MTQLTGKYSVVFCKGHDIYQHSVVATGLHTLTEAREHRLVSGDIVIHSDTKELVMNAAWLWEWEHMGMFYARQMLEQEAKRTGRPVTFESEPQLPQFVLKHLPTNAYVVTIPSVPWKIDHHTTNPAEATRWTGEELVQFIKSRIYESEATGWKPDFNGYAIEAV